jgi:hypothetical protein
MGPEEEDPAKEALAEWRATVVDDTDESMTTS